MAQGHGLPLGGHFGFQQERAETGGPDAEQTFGHDACIQAALGAQMALAALGPCLNGIRHVVAQQTGLGVIVHILVGLVRIAGGINAAQGVEGGTVPESLVARLGQQAVLGPQLR